MEFWLAISQVVTGEETCSIANSDDKNMENNWDTEMAYINKHLQCKFIFSFHEIHSYAAH